MNSFMFSLITVILSISVSTIALLKNILPFLVMGLVYIPMLPNIVLRFLSIASTSQHDAITSMTALAQLCAINNLVSFDHYCLDCASDNVATHRLCYSLGILPVFDINKRGSNKHLYLPYKDISKNGRPIRDGFEKARNRHKFRCPFTFKR